MSNTTIINRSADDSVEEKVIYELEVEDNNKYHLLGQAIGINMDHCVILGSRHKDDFWNRVYGYRIIQNGEIAEMILDAVKKIKPKTESYMTVCFYERQSEDSVMFVPQRLEIPNRPELNNFPFNIVFGIVTLTDNDTQRHETSVYEPDLTTFTEEGDEQRMRYYNTLNPERYFWSEIVYNTSDQSYVGTKYCGDKSAGMAFGKNWDMFFLHFTALGVGSGLDITNS